MVKFLKEWALPITMGVGALFYKPIIHLGFLTPYLLFTMLFVTFTRLKLSEVRILPLHLWLLAFQLFGSLAIYFLLRLFDPLIAEGVFVCILVPTATSAAVITSMLGGSLAILATYSLVSSLSIALIAPFYFSFIGSHSDLPFIDSFITILNQVFPLLILPFFAAIALSKIAPKAHRFLREKQSISFVLWAIALTIVMARTVSYLVEHGSENLLPILLISLGSMITCIAQFLIGRKIGRRFGDTVAGGQALGQKNTILAIWMAQVYLNPLSSIGPSMYVVWQNIVNSYQLWLFRHKHKQIS